MSTMMLKGIRIDSANTYLRCAWLLAVIMLLNQDTLAQRDTAVFRQREKIQPSLLKTNLGAIGWGPISIPPDDTTTFATPLTSEYKLMYEMCFAPNQSAVLGVSYLGKHVLFLMASNDTSQLSKEIKNIFIGGYRVQGMYRIYFNPSTKQAPRGFYMGPHASYSYCKVNLKTDPDYYIKMINWNINALLGYQIVIGNAVSLEMFGGLGYKNNTMSVHNPGKQIENYTYGKVLPHTKFSLGFSFGIAL